MSPVMNINGRMVGPDYPPLVIVEIGINHEGSLDIAKKMVDAAAKAGAEVIKHQTHIVEDEMSDEAKSVIPGNTDVSIYEVMERCALNEEDERALQAYVIQKGMMFISTPFSRAAFYRLESMNVPAYKIGSGECNNYPLIRMIAEAGKPVIMSTGMNSIDSIAKSVDILESHDIPYALLHCTNIYPTPYNLVRLAGIERLKEAFPKAVVGLSDHTIDNYCALGSIALGSSIIERHFTDRKDRPGPDIVCSMDGDELKSLILGSRAIHEARGGEKEIAQEEIVTADFAFASVVADDDIETGDVISKENIWVKRPGTGDFSADDYESLMGRKAIRDVKKGSQLKFADIE